MIVFSQGVTKHSRLGNSLVWMLKLHAILKNNKFNDFIFPWGYENYGDYLRSDSPWLRRSVLAELEFKKLFGYDLTASSLARCSRYIERDIEEKLGVAAFSQKEIVEDVNQNLLYISGSVSIFEKCILEKISKSKFTIIHEPYNLRLGDRVHDSEDYSSIAPGHSFIERQVNWLKQFSSGGHSVGLHIRRGDYQSWQNGRYYFDDQFWLNLVLKNKEEGKSVFIYSNDLSDGFRDDLIGVGAIISDGGFEDDFVRMMLMSELIGPPSTFTGMATQISKGVLSVFPKLSILPPITI